MVLTSVRLKETYLDRYKLSIMDNFVLYPYYLFHELLFSFFRGTASGPSSCLDTGRKGRPRSLSKVFH